MRSVFILGAGALIAAASGAGAQQRVVMHGPGASYGVPGRTPVIHRPVTGPIVHHGGGRWGSRIGGRWWGGVNAPGGWGAYRQPVRGWVLPSYWYAPRFFVNDWQSYGFRAPAPGYTWVRYYDDAVLVDGRGSVYDTVGGVDWDRYDGAEYATDGYDGDRDAPFRERRDNGLGGAAIGAVAGGVAGNLIAGRGNRLGGTLIGAGVGGAAGYAIDRAEDRGRRAPPPLPPVAPEYGAGYGAGYAPPPPPPPPPPHGYAAGGPSWISPDGRTTVVTTGGYGGTTTVVVQSAPVVTTTVTEEVVEDHVTYTHRPMRTKYVKRYRKPACRC